MSARDLSSYIGVEGELVIDNTNKDVVLMDGITKGGKSLLGDNRPSITSGVKNNKALTVQDGIIVDVDGNPIREMGFTMQGLTDIALSEKYVTGTNDPIRAIREYAKQGYTISRIAMIPSWWAGSIKSFVDNNALWWEKMAAILNEFHNNGIGVFIDVVHEIHAPLDYLYTFEGQTTLKTRTAYLDFDGPLIQWYKDRIDEFMAVFGDHPAIAGWGIINEGEMNMIWPNMPKVNETNRTRPASAIGTKEEEILSVTEYGQVYAHLADYLRSVDIHNRIITNNSGGYFNNQTLKGREYYGNFAVDTLCPSVNIDVVSTHEYGFHAKDWSDFEDYLTFMRKRSYESGKAYALTEFNISRNSLAELNEGNSYAQQQRMILQAIVNSGTQIALAWEWEGMYYDSEAGDYWKYQKGIDGSQTKQNVDDDWNFFRGPRANNEDVQELTRLQAEYAVRHRNMEFVHPDDIAVSQFSNDVRSSGTMVIPAAGAEITFDLTSVQRPDGISYGIWFKTPADITTLSDMTLFEKSNMSGWTWGDEGFWTLFNSEGLASYWLHEPLSGQTTNGSLGKTLVYPTGYNNRAYDTSADAPTFLNNWKPNTWYYFHIQRNTTDDIQNYITMTNGYVTQTIPRKPSAISNYDWIDNTGVLTIGNHSSADVNNKLRDCEIGEFSIYNRALTATEMRNKYFNNITPTGSLAARWHWGTDGLTDGISGITGTIVNGSVTFGDGFVLPTGSMN